MAKVMLRYDESRPVDDMEEITIEFLIQDLPAVCIRCGKPAVEVTDLTFYNYNGGRMVSIKAPVCQGHPLLGWMFPMIVLCITACVLLMPVFLLVEFVLNIKWLAGALFYLMLFILAIGVGIVFIFRIFENQTQDNRDAVKNPFFAGKAPTKPFPVLTPPLASKPVSPKGLGGLIAYWPMDEAAGERIADQSPSRVDGTVVGAEWVQGISGSALWFDGQRSFVNLGDAAPLNFAEGQPFTFCGWVGTRADQGTMLSLRHLQNPGADVDIQVSGGNLTAAVRADGAEFGVATLAGQSVNDGTWHHFALVRLPDGQIELFLDGKSQGKKMGGNSKGAITTNLRALGAEMYWVHTNWSLEHPLLTGALDEVCVFNRVLSKEEIESLAGQKK